MLHTGHTKDTKELVYMIKSMNHPLHLFAKMALYEVDNKTLKTFYSSCKQMAGGTENIAKLVSLSTMQWR